MAEYFFFRDEARRFHDEHVRDFVEIEKSSKNLLFPRKIYKSNLRHIIHCGDGSGMYNRCKS